MNSTTLPTACPFLPKVSGSFRADHPICPTAPSDAYNHRLAFAQSLWLEQKPAQALLQLNHALAVDLDDDSSAYQASSWPYAAKLWIVHNCPPKNFLGNPVRHYQHYATRIPPHASLRELRSARAWICFHLMQAHLPSRDYPADHEQIARESIQIPPITELLNRFASFPRPREQACIATLLT